MQMQSREIMDLVELIGLGDGNKKAIGRLKNDVRRSVRKTFSPKTRDVLKNVEARLSVRSGAPGCAQVPQNLSKHFHDVRSGSSVTITVLRSQHGLLPGHSFHCIVAVKLGAVLWDCL